MKNSPFSIHNLNPGLVEEVESAYAKNVEAGRVVDDKFTSDVAVGSLAEKVKQTTHKEHDAGEFYAKLKYSIENIDTLKSFVEAFSRETALFNRVNVDLPDIEQFTENAVDFENLARKYEDMEAENLEPMVVITPYELELDTWRKLYDELSKDTLTQAENAGLEIADAAANQWDRLGMLTFIEHLPVTCLPGQTNNAGTPRWTIRIIPGTDAPQATGIMHKDLMKSRITTLPEYLTMQATRIGSGDQPIDRESYTWINGSLNNGNAVMTKWQDHYASVAVYVMQETHVSDKIGTRIPQW